MWPPDKRDNFLRVLFEEIRHVIMLRAQRVKFQRGNKKVPSQHLINAETVE